MTAKRASAICTPTGCMAAPVCGCRIADIRRKMTQREREKLLKMDIFKNKVLIGMYFQIFTQSSQDRILHCATEGRRLQKEKIPGIDGKSGSKKARTAGVKKEKNLIARNY